MRKYTVYIVGIFLSTVGIIALFFGVSRLHPLVFQLHSVKGGTGLYLIFLMQVSILYLLVGITWLVEGICNRYKNMKEGYEL